MKTLINDIVSLGKWIFTIAALVGFMRYLHLIFMSGVNPIVSNGLLLVLLIGLILYIIIGKPFRHRPSVLAIVLATLLGISIGFLIGKIFLEEAVSSSTDFVPRRYYN